MGNIITKIIGIVVSLISPKISKFIFLLYALIGIHVSLFSPVGSGLYLAYNLISWILIALIIGIGFWNLSLNKSFQYTNLHSWVLISVILLSIPMFYANADKFHAFPRFLGLIAGLLFLFSLYQLKFSTKDKIDLVYLLLIGVVIEAVIGIFQFYIFTPLAIDAGNYELLNGRPSGVFRQPNVMASFMAVGILISLALVYFDKKITRLKKVFLKFSLLILVVVLILLQSKTGYLGVLVAIALFIPILIRKFNQYKSYILVIIVGIMIGVVSMINIQSINRGTKLYSDEGVRTDIIKVSGDMYSKKPLLGVGYGKFEQSYRKSHFEQMSINPNLSGPVTNLDHPHNEFLLWGIEGGIISLVGALLLCVGFISIFKGRFHLDKLLFLSLICPIFIHTQTEKPFYLSTPHWVYFLVLIWLADESLSRVSFRRVHSFLVARITAILIPLLTIPFMLTALNTSLLMEEFIKSDYQKKSALNAIVNHMVWNDYFQEFFNNSGFYNGLTTNSTESLLNYVLWGSEYIETTPRQHIYENIIVAINILNIEGITLPAGLEEKVRKNAKMLYPNRERWGDIQRAYSSIKS